MNLPQFVCLEPLTKLLDEKKAKKEINRDRQDEIIRDDGFEDRH